jgi:competence protein ComEC
LDALEPGEALALEADLRGWRRVRLPDGRSGYVSEAWTIVVDAPRATFTVHGIDLGTGLAILVEGPDFTLLYDGGSNDDIARGSLNRLSAYLRAARPDLTRIDHMVLSHPHRDHVELLPDVLDRYEVGNVYDSGRVHPICGYRAFLERVSREPGVRYHTAGPAGMRHSARFPAATCYGTRREAEVLSIPRTPISERVAIPLGSGSTMTFLHADGSMHHSPNENSLVLRLDLGGRRLLLTGDAEAGGRKDPADAPDPDSIEGRLVSCCSADLRADVLVVGHHGSKTSSRRRFLDSVGAGFFIVSAGPTRYGAITLPDREVVEELAGRGVVLRTDLTDDRCGAESVKTGPDADGEAGGCDNIRVTISDDAISAGYVRPDG